SAAARVVRRVRDGRRALELERNQHAPPMSGRLLLWWATGMEGAACPLAQSDSDERRSAGGVRSGSDAAQTQHRQRPHRRLPGVVAFEPVQAHKCAQDDAAVDRVSLAERLPRCSPLSLVQLAPLDLPRLPPDAPLAEPAG